MYKLGKSLKLVTFMLYLGKKKTKKTHTQLRILPLHKLDISFW